MLAERTSKIRTRREWLVLIVRDLIVCLGAWTGGVAFQARVWPLVVFMAVVTVIFLAFTSPAMRAAWRK